MSAGPAARPRRWLTQTRGNGCGVTIRAGEAVTVLTAGPGSGYARVSADDGRTVLVPHAVLAAQPPCPLHDNCERYLPAEACEYRAGRVSFAEAEDEAYHRSGLSVCTEWAANE